MLAARIDEPAGHERATPFFQRPEGTRIMRVEHFMTKDPVTCDRQDSIQQVAQLMDEKGVGCVVVLQNGKLRGLVTDRQIATKAVARGVGPESPVEEILPPPDQHPAAVGIDDNVFAVLDTMRSAGVVRRVPVITRDADVLGIVSISDIAVIAKDLLDAVLLEEVHNATKEAHVLTGGKRIAKDIRRPTKTDRLEHLEQDTKPVRRPTTQSGRTRGEDLPGDAGREDATRKPETRRS